MKKYIYILILIPFINSCNQKKDIQNKIENGILNNYIDNYDVIPDNCLKQIINSLNNIVWQEDITQINFGVSFLPKRIKNKERLFDEKPVYVAFERMDIRYNVDTNYFIEVYTFDKILNSFIPCYLEEKNIIHIDSAYTVTPNLNYLKNNCIIKVSNFDLKPGIWREVDDNHKPIIDNVSNGTFDKK